MNSEKILEPVIVGAIYEPAANVKPVWFIWNGRKIKVVRTNHAWSQREGTATLYNFSVTDGTDTFHLVMNNDTQSWHLEGVQVSA